MKSFFILRLITIYAHSSCPPCSCCSFVYHSVVSPASQGTGWFNATKSIEGLKGFYSLAILLQSTLGCTASLWIDPTVHFWQWIAKFIPSFLMPVVFPLATGLFHGSFYNRIVSSKGFFSEDKTKCAFVNSPNVWQGLPAKALIYKESFCQ